MSQPQMVVKLGDETWNFDGLMLQEMRQVSRMTSYRSRPEWTRAILNEEPDALAAALVIVKQRKGKRIAIDEAQFDLDGLEVWFQVPSGQRCEPALEKAIDGTTRLDKNGRPMPVFDSHGDQMWVDVETGEPVSLSDEPKA